MRSLLVTITDVSGTRWMAVKTEKLRGRSHLELVLNKS